MVWYSHLFQNFPQFVVMHTVKDIGIVNKAEIDVFLECSHFFNDPADAGNLISGSSSFSKSSLNIWKFTVHILLNPALESFENYFVSMSDKICLKMTSKLQTNYFRKGKRKAMLYIFLKYELSSHTLREYRKLCFLKSPKIFLTNVQDWASLVAGGKEFTCIAVDAGLIPGLGRSCGEGNGNPPQYLAWEIPRTEEPGGLRPWGRKSQMQLSNSTTTQCTRGVGTPDLEAETKHMKQMREKYRGIFSHFSMREYFKYVKAKENNSLIY